jgi:hypothetical protein
VLSTHALLLGWIAWRNSPTVGEVPHLAAGLSHWVFGSFDLYRVNPPLVRCLAALPVLCCNARTDWSAYDSSVGSRAEFAVGDAFLAANGQNVFWYFTIARLSCIPLSVIGGYYCYRWACWLYGAAPGLVAAALWSFCPNILGNAAMITPDAGAAAVGVTFGYYAHRWLHHPQWGRALPASLSLGIAELTRTTWVILFPLLPILWLASVLAKPATWPKGAWRSEVAQLCSILLFAIYLINFGYGFERSCLRLGDYRFISHTLGGSYGDAEYGNCFTQSRLAWLPVPFPASYVEGLDIQKADFERGMLSYLRGKQRLGGWWYYYLYAFAVKVPLGTLVIALMAMWCSIRYRGYSAGALNELIVIAPAIVVLALVSSQTGFSRYFRYVLPVLPFVFVWISKIARRRSWGPRPLCFVLASSLCWSIVSSMAVYPHSLSYFNELGGGPVGGPLHLVDSNIDWGQDLFYLARWSKAHADARPLFISYFGRVDPDTAGISAVNLWYRTKGSQEPYPASKDLGPFTSGWYAISVNHLRGYRHWRGHGNPDYGVFLSAAPVAMAGYSIYIYRVGSEGLDFSDASDECAVFRPFGP